jgi:hypothetical protein
VPPPAKYRVASKAAGSKLEQLVQLSKRREELLAELQDLERQMVGLEQEFSASARQKIVKAKVTISTEPIKRRGRRRSQAR